MSASKRFFWPSAVTLALLVAFVSQACGGAECLRNSDCGSHLECHQGKCAKHGSPDDSGAAGEGAGGMSAQ